MAVCFPLKFFLSKAGNPKRSKQQKARTIDGECVDWESPEPHVLSWTQRIFIPPPVEDSNPDLSKTC
jgi:hypothetical protein